MRGKGGADWGRIRGFGSFDPAASTIVLLDFGRSHLIRGYLLIKKRWTSGIAGRNDSSRSIRRQDHNSWCCVCFLKHTEARCSSFLREDCKLDHRFFDSAPANGGSFPDDPWSSRLRVADWGRPTEIRVGSGWSRRPALNETLPSIPDIRSNPVVVWRIRPDISRIAKSTGGFDSHPLEYRGRLADSTPVADTRTNFRWDTRNWLVTPVSSSI